MLYTFKIIVYMSFILLFTGCGYTIPTPQERLVSVDKVVKQKHLYKKIYKTKTFDIFSYSTDLSQCKTGDLDVYIGGDGLSWITSSTISDNPTPIHPLTLELMVEDDAKCKVYLARPCQYVQNAQCTQKVWTSDRFSQNVIDSYNEILDSLQYKKLTLFGYSGGGAVATLLSAQRDDVDELVTIAGNLDIKFWARKHYITPLKGSLNPSDYASKLEDIKQVHLVGEDDDIVGMSVFNAYKSHFSDDKNVKFLLYKNFTHSCCWVKEWKNILGEVRNTF